MKNTQHLVVVVVVVINKHSLTLLLRKQTVIMDRKPVVRATETVVTGLASQGKSATPEFRKQGFSNTKLIFFCFLAATSLFKFRERERKTRETRGCTAPLVWVISVKSVEPFYVGCSGILSQVILSINATLF